MRAPSYPFKFASKNAERGRMRRIVLIMPVILFEHALSVFEKADLPERRDRRGDLAVRNRGIRPDLNFRRHRNPFDRPICVSKVFVHGRTYTQSVYALTENADRFSSAPEKQFTVLFLKHDLTSSAFQAISFKKS